MVPCRDGGVDTCHCPHEYRGFILILHDGSPSSHRIRAMGQPVVAGPPAESPGGHPILGENRHALISSAGGDLPHTPATAEEASDTAPALVSHPVPRPTKPVLRTVFLPATNSLNRVCLEDRPGATISFTGHDAQPKTGTTPAPPKATVNDDHPPQQGVLKRYKPINFYCALTTDVIVNVSKPTTNVNTSWAHPPCSSLRQLPGSHAPAFGGLQRRPPWATIGRPGNLSDGMVDSARWPRRKTERPSRRRNTIEDTKQRVWLSTHESRRWGLER